MLKAGDAFRATAFAVLEARSRRLRRTVLSVVGFWCGAWALASAFLPPSSFGEDGVVWALWGLSQFVVLLAASAAFAMIMNRRIDPLIDQLRAEPGSE